MNVQGHCDQRFAEVAGEFDRNFAERGELGASVAVTVGGETVVDLWGGWATADRSIPWEKDTLCVMMSCTKGAAALCAHLLASAGQLGQFFASEVARPLGLDLWLGLPESEHGRVAEFLPPAPPEPGVVEQPASAFMTLAITEPDSIPGCVYNNGGYLAPGRVGLARRPCCRPAIIRWCRPRQVPGRHVPGHRARPGHRAFRLRRRGPQSDERGAIGSVGGRHPAWPRPMDARLSQGSATPKGVRPAARVSLSEEAFGHTGFGGSIGFADQPAEMSFAYVMNQMGADMGLSPTGQSLVDAVYRALGYRRSKYDTWVR